MESDVVVRCHRTHGTSTYSTSRPGGLRLEWMLFTSTRTPATTGSSRARSVATRSRSTPWCWSRSRDLPRVCDPLPSGRNVLHDRRARLGRQDPVHPCRRCTSGASPGHPSPAGVRAARDAALPRDLQGAGAGEVGRGGGLLGDPRRGGGGDRAGRERLREDRKSQRSRDYSWDLGHLVPAVLVRELDVQDVRDPVDHAPVLGPSMASRKCCELTCASAAASSSKASMVTMVSGSSTLRYLIRCRVPTPRNLMPSPDGPHAPPVHWEDDRA